MLLANLYAHAVANGLGQSALIRRTITYYLVLDANGYKDLLFVEEDRDVPFVKRTMDVKPNPLCDQAPYVLGAVPKGKTEKYAQDRFNAFWEDAEKLLQAAGDAVALKAVRKLKEDTTWQARARKKLGDDGWIALTYERGGLFLDRPLVKAHIAKLFEEKLKGSANAPHHCLITGEPCESVILHDPVSGVPGTGSRGSPLVSFNVKTAAQEGFEQGLNFPVGFKAMKGYTSALNHLLKTSRAILGKNVCGVFWGIEGASAIALAIHAFSAKGDNPEKARLKTEADRKAAWATIERLTDADGDLHMAFFKGSQGRIAVLSYDVRPVRDVAKSLLAFRDHFMQHLDFQVSVGSVTLRAEGSRVDLLATTVRVEIARAILLGNIMPERFVTHLFSTINYREPARSHMLLAWLEFANRIEGRRKRMVMTDEKPDLKEYVLCTNDSQAYILGRLVAMEHTLKIQAHRRRMPSDSIVSALTLACSAPGVYFAKCARNIEVYKAKMWRHGGRREFRDLTGEIMTQLRKARFIEQVTPLSLPERAQLHLGFEHQQEYNIHVVRHGKATREKEEAAQAS